MNILLLGSTGQLGHALQTSLKGMGHITALSRSDLDLTQANAEHIEALFLKHQPHWVINASAYTAVDLAETEKEAAYQVNAKAPELLAKACTQHNAALIHYSTDFVFDGQKMSPYVEEDACHPLSVYGQSKLLGELAIQEHCKKHLIFRTGWLMGAHGGNFLKTMLKLASTKSELKVIDDQFGAPTPATWLADVTHSAIEQSQALKAQQQPASPLWGLYHASGAGEISWHVYAKAVIEEALALGFSLNLNAEKVMPIPASDYPLPAKRPVYSVLNCEKLKHVFKIEQPNWRQSVVEVLRAIVTPT